MDERLLEEEMLELLELLGVGRVGEGTDETEESEESEEEASTEMDAALEELTLEMELELEDTGAVGSTLAVGAASPSSTALTMYGSGTMRSGGVMLVFQVKLMPKSGCSQL